MKKGAVAAVAILAAALLALVAGCGGDDSTSSITKAQFVKRANAICKQGEKAFQKRLQIIGGAAETAGKPLTKAEQEEALLSIFQGPYEKEIKAISDLPTPEGDDGEVDEIIEAMEETLVKAEADPAELGDSRSQFTAVNKMHEEYGLTACVI